MIRFRWAVLVVWLVLFVAAGTASARLPDLLTNRFVLPGAESEKTGDVLETHFGQKPAGAFTIVVRGTVAIVVEPSGPSMTSCVGSTSSEYTSRCPHV